MSKKLQKEIKHAKIENNEAEKQTSLVSFTNPKPVFTQEQVDRFLTIAIYSGLILGILLLAYKIIPQKIYPATNFAKIEQQKEDERKNEELIARKKREFEENKEKETQAISGKKLANIDTNFGEIKIELSDLVPNTTDNFKRLIYRDLYKENQFHRIVKKDNFSVIQGGDLGRFASAALSDTLNDEVWKVAPTFDEQGKLTNEAQFFDPSLYKDFKTLGIYQGAQINEVIYPKGTIVMAKTIMPNSATTQFFITLKDTKLEPNYTAFGKVQNPEILDKIYNEVGVKNLEGQNNSSDGEPDKKIEIKSINLN